MQGFFDESSRLLPALPDGVDASGCKQETVVAMIGCRMILPTPRPHSASRSAAASLVVGVSAPFAQSPPSGSLRPPKETSGTLGALPTALPHVRLPIFAHDPATAPPAALTSTGDVFIAIPNPLCPIPSTSACLLPCAVLCCGACSSSTSPCRVNPSVWYSATRHSPYPTSTNTVSGSLPLCSYQTEQATLYRFLPCLEHPPLLFRGPQ